MANYGKKDIDKSLKNRLFRIIFSTFILVAVVLGIYLVFPIITSNKDNAYFLNIMSNCVLVVFAVIEAGILIRNLNIKLAIYQMVFNEENGTYNRMGLVIANVSLLVGLGLLIGGIMLYVTAGDIVINLVAGATLLPIGYFLSVNCLGYDVYALLFKDRFKMADLL